jgi:hypothetical protein
MQRTLDGGIWLPHKYWFLGGVRGSSPSFHEYEQSIKHCGADQAMTKSTILRAFVVSILLAFITVATTAVLSATYLAQPMGAEPTVVRGIEAIRLWINVAGVWSVLKSHAGWFLSVTVCTFVACLVFLRWETGTGDH